jgi:hypothetical protein
MNEIKLLELFHDEMKVSGVRKEVVTLNIDEDLIAKVLVKYREKVDIDKLEELADVCIANEWLVRTTADIRYNFLSLTASGLQLVLLHLYKEDI